MHFSWLDDCWVCVCFMPYFRIYYYRYRKLGESRWETIHVTPPGSQRITIRNLSPGTTYQFQIVGTNELGEGHPSEIINVTTKGNLYSSLRFPLNPQVNVFNDMGGVLACLYYYQKTTTVGLFCAKFSSLNYVMR